VGAEFYARREGVLTTLRVATVRFQRGRPIVGMAGVSTISEAERLANLELRVPADALHRLPDGTYYEHDLVGCRVESTAGQEVGTVRDVGGEAGHRWLVIDGRAGEILVPFASEICVRIDIAGRRIVVDPPEGLLEANERSR
jgi:16S rRNA processing protein RimM